MTGPDYGQDAGPLIRAFFQDWDNKTEYSEDKDLKVFGDGAEDVLFMDLSENSFRLSLVYNGERSEITDDFSVTPEGCYKNSGKPDRRMYRNHLHRAIYKLLSDATKRTLPWGTLTGVRPTKQALDMKRLAFSDEKIVSYFKNEYLTSENKAKMLCRVSDNERRIIGGIDLEDSYSLYIGVPFCPSICLYCSFSSYPLKVYKDSVEPYISALLKEIEETAKIFKDKKLITVYFGGGTPTTLEPDQLERVICKVRECFDLSNLLEWTVEAGRPDSITKEKLKVLKEQGITRISVNPQSMQQKTLDLIGRRHTTEETVAAFKLAREAGFDNINMDLIAGLNGENADDFRNTLKEIALLDPDSVTVHTLAVKRAARLNEKKDEYRDSMATDTRQMLEDAEEFARLHGYEPYYLYRQKNMSDNLENIGYAKPGKEGIYNILIMEECHSIVACGPGGASKLVRTDDVFGQGFLDETRDDEEYTVRKIERAENVKSVKDYIERTDEMIERKRKLFSGEIG